MLIYIADIYWELSDLQKIRFMARTTSLQRSAKLANLKYTTITQMFAEVEEIKEMDLVAGAQHGDRHYIDSILHKLPGSYAVQKELIPKDDEQKSSLSNIKQTLLRRELAIEEERKIAKERTAQMKVAAHMAAAGEGHGMLGGGGSNASIKCYECGEYGHKAINCPTKFKRAPWRGGYRGRGAGGNRQYVDRRPYNPKYNQNQQHNRQQNRPQQQHNRMAAPAAAHVDRNRQQQPMHNGNQNQNRNGQNSRGRGQGKRVQFNNQQ